PRARSSRTLKRSTGKCFGTRGTKSSTFTRRSAATQQVASPAPASPDIYGSTTLSAAAVATAASKALPPWLSSRAPACAASGCAAATTPLVDEMVGRRPCMKSSPQIAPWQHACPRRRKHPRRGSRFCGLRIDRRRRNGNYAGTLRRLCHSEDVLVCVVEGKSAVEDADVADRGTCTYVGKRPERGAVRQAVPIDADVVTELDREQLH